MRSRLETVARARTATAATPGASGLDWAMVGTCGWFQLGAYLDAWAHTHRPDLETFFTPWHAVLYSGFLAVSGLLLVTFVRHRRRGRPAARALPAGYGLSLLGVAVFAAGGLGDLFWHTLVGIETDVEALLSPPHLVLAVGSTLIVTGPLRAAWRRADLDAPTSALWPMVFSLAFLLSSFTFWTQYAHHVARPWAAAGNRPTVLPFPVAAPDPLFQGGGLQTVFVAHALGIASILLQAGLLAGVTLLAVRRWGSGLPAGAFTFVCAANAALMGLARDQLALIPFLALGGAAIDLLLRGLGAAVARPARLRLFAFAAPAAYFACYFLGLGLTRDVWWSAPLWTGSILLAGAAGWLLSYLVAPPGLEPDGL